ncbi:transport protein particle component, Bet3 [Ancylostoma ceylanicum]|uniref:Trafficking protein particle complex subunit 5 n=1 Tax=Ancylostoma ceylanicum TaxID=53326 RepID=A0A0D6LJG7_9BILA|nr:transport protein particle component, Bet3 [Ancylostoma ceylanicum]
MVEAAKDIDDPYSMFVEVSLSTFALLFSEVVKYAQERSETVTDIHDRLASYGKIVGIRLLDVVTLREKGYRRETKLLGMLMFIKSSVWKNLFGKEADKLERSNDDQCTYLLIEKEPVVNTFISVPKDKGMLNCAAFVAGIIQAMLEASNFPCQVSAHWWNIGTAYVIRFDEVVISREAALVDGTR